MRDLKLEACLRIFREHSPEMYEYIKDRKKSELDMYEVSGYARDLLDANKTCTAQPDLEDMEDPESPEFVINFYGTKIDFEVAVSLMDDEICEDLHLEIAPCTAQEFFDAYCEAHETKFGSEFECAKKNPCI